MKKQIALAVFLLAASPLHAMDEGESEKRNKESVKQNSKREQVSFCAFFTPVSALGKQALSTWRSMKIKGKIEEVVSNIAETLEFEGQEQSESDKSEQLEEDTEEIKNLKKQVLQLKQQLEKKQITDDEKYARWLSDNQDQEQ